MRRATAKRRKPVKLGDTMRVSREGVAQIKQALDVVVTQTEEKHTLE